MTDFQADCVQAKLSRPNIDDAVKSRKPDGFEKSSRYGEQISRNEDYLCMPQRLRDAAQRRDWVFCGTVKHHPLSGLVRRRPLGKGQRGVQGFDVVLLGGVDARDIGVQDVRHDGIVEAVQTGVAK